MACQIYYSLMSHLTPHVSVHVHTHTHRHSHLFFSNLRDGVCRQTDNQTDNQTDRQTDTEPRRLAEPQTFSDHLQHHLNGTRSATLSSSVKKHPAWSGADLSKTRLPRRNQLRTREWNRSQNSRWLQGLFRLRPSRWRLRWWWQNLAVQLMMESGFNRPPAVMWSWLVSDW